MIVAFCYFIYLDRKAIEQSAFFIKHSCFGSLSRKCCSDFEVNKVIKNQHETQISHGIKLRSSSNIYKPVAVTRSRYFIPVLLDHTALLDLECLV